MKTILIFVGLLYATFSLSQEEENYFNRLTKANCGTAEHVYKDLKDLEYDNRPSNRKNAGFTQWPLRAHIVTRNDGTGGLTLDELNAALANLNYVYSDISLEWYLADVNYIASDTWYDFVDTGTNEQDIWDAHGVDDAVNVFFVGTLTSSGGGSLCGFAYYPCNNDICLRIFMRNSCTATVANGTFAHEFGHHLNLPHTHNGTSNGNTHANAEHVPRSGAQSNCSTKGDYQCDTEADPTGATANCNYTGGGSDVHGNPYVPTTDNIMSYYPDGCGGLLSAGQYNRCSNAVTTRLNHTAYDIDGAPFDAVYDPSGLTITATDGTNSIDLIWTDNASNEDGYLIERSDDGGTTFSTVELSGVGPNTTTFTDTYELQGNTTYCYRVKASNDNPNHYSNQTCVTTDNIICGADTDLLFSGGGLIQTPFDIVGIPTSIPSCQTDVPVTVTAYGDFGSGFESTDILGEDGTTVLGSTGTSASDCHSAGAQATFNLTAAQYNAWASNGTITFYLAANSGVNDFCGANYVTGCCEIEICTSNPCDFATVNITNADLTGDNMLFDDIEDITTSAQIIYDNIIFRPANSITLNNGFEVAAGKQFTSEIGPCP